MNGGRTAIPMQREPAAAFPPPRQGPLRWLRQNLFSSWANTALTLVTLYCIYLAAKALIGFAAIDAVWPGENGAACLQRQGACWPFIAAKFDQFIYGRYPAAERWRVNLTGALLLAGLIPLFLPRLRLIRAALAYFFFIFPIAAASLLAGGAFGLVPVETALWGGLFLTLVVAAAGMAASLPLGIILALARRSSMPVIRWLAIIFIEFWRGAPLVTMLFMASVMLPLFLPEGVTLNKLLRALIAVALFASAYMAEVVRGGLQSIPAAQYQGATALGLSHWQSLRFIILPQALTNVIPGIVNTFIGLFKDTTLVLIIGLFDFLGMIQLGLADPAWGASSISQTAYLFAAAVFFIFCFALSRYARSLEQRLSGARRTAKF